MPNVNPLICFVVGARPNFVKAAPVYHALAATPNVDLLLVHPARLRRSDVRRVLGGAWYPSPDVFLNVGSGSHGEQTASALVGVERER